MSDTTKETKGSFNKKAPNDFPMPEVNFTTFIMSLNAATLVSLGETADPSTGTKKTNLPFAKQTIDILAMLQEKTKGNLTDEESRLLTNILYELRLLYVKATSR